MAGRTRSRFYAEASELGGTNHGLVNLAGPTVAMREIPRFHGQLLEGLDEGLPMCDI